MDPRANYVAVGAFVLLVLAGIFVAGLWLARVQLQTAYKYYETGIPGPGTGRGGCAAPCGRVRTAITVSGCIPCRSSARTPVMSRLGQEITADVSSPRAAAIPDR